MPALLLYGLAAVAVTTGAVGATELVTKSRRAERQRVEARRTLLLKPGAFRRAVAADAEETRIEVTDLTSRRDGATERARRAKNLGTAIREGLLKGKIKILPWVTAGVVLFTVIWAVAVAIEVDIDARSFRGLGYSNPMALSLALLTTVLFCVLGILVSDLVGLTHMLPAIGDMSLTRRVALIGSVGLVFLLAASQLPRIAEYRSESIALQVQAAQNARQALLVLPASQRPAIVVNQTDRQLAEAKARLATARYADKRLAIGAAGLEAITSWAVAWSLLLAACLCAALLATGATRKAEAATAAIGNANQRFFARIAALAVDLEVDRDEVVAALNEVQVAADSPPQTVQDLPGALPGVSEPTLSEETAPAAPAAEPETVMPESEPDATDSDPYWNAF